MKQVLQVQGLSKSFGKNQVLDGVSFELAEGSVNVLLGSNGEGKSTLLRCLLGLLKPAAGEITVLGDRRLRRREVRECMGYVPDEADACGWMTAPELFRFLSVQYPLWSDEKQRSLADRLRVPMKTRIDAMSRGEAAKAMLVAALSSQPRLLLLDEPFARLAPPVREEVLRVFLEEAPLEGGAVLLATHHLEVAARAADRVLLLNQGKVTEDVGIDPLLTQPGMEGTLTERLRALYPETADEEVAA